MSDKRCLRSPKVEDVPNQERSEDALVISKIMERKEKIPLSHDQMSNNCERLCKCQIINCQLEIINPEEG